MTEIRVRPEDLRTYVSALLSAAGAREEAARITADVLVLSDLRGHESHGVARLESYYVRPLLSGKINAHAELVMIEEREGSIVFDARNGLGQPAAKHAMDACIARARTAGICMASIRHSNHFGIAAYYAMQALAHDMIGICCTDAGPLAVPTGGRAPMLGSNPIAFAAPAGNHRPFVLDMATSVVPVGKVEVKARRDLPLPSGWAIDDLGAPTDDAQAVLDRLALGGNGGLLPLGGLEAGHKGFGLSVMVDILCSVLAGGRSNTIRGYAPGKQAGISHMVAAIDLGAFRPVDAFKADLDAYIDELHRQPTMPGVDRVRVAGEPEFEAEEERQRDGIPVIATVADSLRALGRELGVKPPF